MCAARHTAKKGMRQERMPFLQKMTTIKTS